MTGPILRIPLSEAEAHRAELAAAKARIATLESAVAAAGEQLARTTEARRSLSALFAASEAKVKELDEMLAECGARDPGLSISDIRDVLLDEANADDGVVRGCLEGDEPQEGDINVVDTIRNLCVSIRQLVEANTAATARADGLTQDALFESESRAEEEAKTAAAIERVHAALLPLAPDAMCSLSSIEEALLSLPSKLVPGELAEERRSRLYWQQASDRIHFILERHAGLSPAAEEDGVEAVLLKLCGVVEKPAKKAPAAKEKTKTKTKKQPTLLDERRGEPDWPPDGGRLAFLEARERDGFAGSVELADLAAIRDGRRCRLCGRLINDHTPGCPGEAGP